jgi:predicted dehydrogenase
VRSRRAILLGAGGFGVEWWPALECLGVEVAAAADVSRDALAAAARRFRLPADRCLDGAGADWPAVEADLVIDSTPPWLHRDNARRAFARGLDVLVAKPMALDLLDARAMVADAECHGRRLLVAQQKRFHPAFLAVRRLVAEGVLGRPGAADVHLNVDGRGWVPGMAWRLEMEQPLLMDGAVHHFDLLRWVLGDEARRVMADSANPPWSPFRGDAWLAAIVEMRSGLRVTYRASWAPSGTPVVAFFSGWRVEFERGWVEVRDGDVYVDGACQHVLPPGGDPDLAALNVEVLRRFLAGGDEAAELSGRDNLRSLALLEAARASIQSGRREEVEIDD